MLKVVCQIAIICPMNLKVAFLLFETLIFSNRLRMQYLMYALQIWLCWNKCLT